jgi:hypothetical protein
MQTITSELPPHAHELENCIVRCPMEGKHSVLLNFTNTLQVELTPGKYTWTDKDQVSEYIIRNVVFSNITYDVTEPDEFDQLTFWTWLHAFVFGPPPVQTVLLSFEVRQSSQVSESSSVRV